MGNKKATTDPRFLHYDTKDVEHLLDEVRDRSFLRDITEDEYEQLSKEEKENGDLYLLHENDDSL
jgi:uncharacterized protein YlbG (UPF0298 family)